MSESKKKRSTSRRRPPDKTIEGREQQLIGYATDLAEKQLLDGTASAAVITHYLKLATVREQIEREKLRNENELLKSKSEAIKANARQEELTQQAIDAFRRYSPNVGSDEY